MGWPDQKILDTDLDIEKLFSSTTFSGKDQMQRLLRILLRYGDRQSTLKPDRVILELWGDKSSTRTPANLATEMNRLRRLLLVYYAAEGASDPVRIELPTRITKGPRVASNAWIVMVPVAAPAVGPDATEQASPANSALLEVAKTAKSGPETNGSVAGAMRRHGWLWGMAVACAMLLVAVPVVLYRAAHRAVPQAMRLDGKFLRVLDSDGKELWHQFFADGFWPEYYKDETRTKVVFTDLDGSGRMSVVFAYHPANEPTMHATTVIAYSDKGKEKWRWTPGRSFAVEDLNPSFFKVLKLDVLKPAHGHGARVVVSSYHPVFYPHQIAVLDAWGKLSGEYWHAGHLDWMTVADLDGNGQQQIIASGVSNGYYKGTLVVLDAEHMDGASVEQTRPDIQISGLPPAHERARLVFPRSDLGLLATPYSVAQRPTVDQGQIQVTVAELVPNTAERSECTYRFDHNLKLLRMDVDDGFRQNHDAYFRTALPKHVWSSVEAAALNQVTCLSGCQTAHVALATNSSHPFAK